MNFEKSKAYLRIIRFNNCLFSFVTVFLSIVIVGSEINYIKALVSASIYFFVFAAGNVINDIFDIEIDRINKPSRPLPSNILSINEAKVVYYISIIVSVLLSVIIGKNETLFIICLNLLIHFYSYRGKRIIFISNLLVAFFVGSAFLFAGIVIQNISIMLIPFAIAFGLNLIREIIKDAEDEIGDISNGVKTIYTAFGLKITLRICYSVVFLLTLIMLIEFSIELFKIEFFIITLLFILYPVVRYLRIIETDFTIPRLRFVSGRIKLIMVLGLLALYLGV